MALVDNTERLRNLIQKANELPESSGVIKDIDIKVFTDADGNIVISDTNDGESSDYSLLSGYIKGKDGEPIEIVDAWVREQIENGDIGGSVNPDWNAKENEDGFILNKPFYSKTTKLELQLEKDESGENIYNETFVSYIIEGVENIPEKMESIIINVGDIASQIEFQYLYSETFWSDDLGEEIVGQDVYQFDNNYFHAYVDVGHYEHFVYLEISFYEEQNTSLYPEKAEFIYGEIVKLPNKYLDIKKSDWNENDSMSNGYIENRTHFKEEKSVVFKLDNVSYSVWEKGYSSSSSMREAIEGLGLNSNLPNDLDTDIQYATYVFKIDNNLEFYNGDDVPDVNFMGKLNRYFGNRHGEYYFVDDDSFNILKTEEKDSILNSQPMIIKMYMYMGDFGGCIVNNTIYVYVFGVESDDDYIRLEEELKLGFSVYERLNKNYLPEDVVYKNDFNPDEISEAIDGMVEKNQGVENSGKMLMVNDNGDIDLIEPLIVTYESIISNSKQVVQNISNTYEEIKSEILKGRTVYAIRKNSDIASYPLFVDNTKIVFGSIYYNENLKYSIGDTLIINNDNTCLYIISREISLGDFISTTNKSPYTPTSDYHPATKKYVDDRSINRLNGNYISSDLKTGIYMVDSWAMVSLKNGDSPDNEITFSDSRIINILKCDDNEFSGIVHAYNNDFKRSDSYCFYLFFNSYENKVYSHIDYLLTTKDKLEVLDCEIGDVEIQSEDPEDWEIDEFNKRMKMIPTVGNIKDYAYETRSDWNADIGEESYILNKPFYDNRNTLFDSNNFDIKNAEKVSSSNGFVFYRVSEHVPFEDLLNLYLMIDGNETLQISEGYDILFGYGLTRLDDGFYYANTIGVISVPTDNYTYSNGSTNITFNKSGLYIENNIFSSYDSFCIGLNLGNIKKIDKKYIPIIDSKISILYGEMFSDGRYSYEELKNGLYFVTGGGVTIYNGDVYSDFEDGSVINIVNNNVRNNRLVGIYSYRTAGQASIRRFCLTDEEYTEEDILFGTIIYDLEDLVEPSDDAENYEWEQYWSDYYSFAYAHTIKEYVDNRAINKLKKGIYNSTDLKEGIYIVDDEWNEEVLVSINDNGDKIHFKNNDVVNVIRSNDYEFVGICNSYNDDIGFAETYSFELLFNSDDNEVYIQKRYHVQNKILDGGIKNVIEPDDSAEEWEFENYFDKLRSLPTVGDVKDYVDDLIAENQPSESVTDDHINSLIDAKLGNIEAILDRIIGGENE